MSKNIILSILLISLLCTVPIASADIDLNPVSVGAQMITDGINNWFRGMGDAAMNAGFEITNVTGAPVEGGSTVNVIFKIASWTYDPYSNPGIVDIIKFTMTIWGVLMLMYILAGMVWVNIQDSKPNAAQSLAFITGMNTNTAFSHYVNNLKDSLMIAVFSHAVIYLILTLNLVFSRMILSTMLDVIAPSPDNILLYLMMGYTYLVMSFFFLVRFFVINIFVAFAPILGILYVTNYFTRSIATKAFNCFCTMVFMQTVIVFFTSIGILAIKGLGPMYARDPSSYIVLMILLVVVAIIMMVGWVFVKRSAKTVVNVVAL